MSLSNATNFYKAAINLLSGRSMSPLSAYYDPRYPPTKFLRGGERIAVRCILSGFPRTGTHWVRNVIEHTTSRPTGDLGLKKPAPGDGEVLLIKIHARSKWFARSKALWLLPRHSFGGKYIYTYRDPRDAIISLYEMYRHKKNASELTPEAFVREHDPIGQFRWEVNSWVAPGHDDVFLVRFEELRAEPLAQFQRLFDYLGIEGSPDREVIDTRVSAQDSTERPRAQVSGWKNAPQRYRWLLDSINEGLEREIRLLGYEPG